MSLLWMAIIVFAAVLVTFAYCAAAYYVLAVSVMLSSRHPLLFALSWPVTVFVPCVYVAIRDWWQKR